VEKSRMLAAYGAFPEEMLLQAWVFCAMRQGIVKMEFL